MPGVRSYGRKPWGEDFFTVYGSSYQTTALDSISIHFGSSGDSVRLPSLFETDLTLPRCLWKTTSIAHLKQSTCQVSGTTGGRDYTHVETALTFSVVIFLVVTS